MATRFYLPMGGAAPPVSPAVGAQWDVTPTGFARSITDTAKSQNTAISAEVSANYGETSASPVNVVHRQYVSGPLAAQTVSGTFSAVVRGGEDAATNDASLQVVLRVVSGDGTTQRGVLYAGHAAPLNATVGELGQEWATGSQSRIIPAGTALSDVAVQAGDRLVIEVGHRHLNTLTTAATGWLTLGDTAATADFALTAGLTTVLNPWVEFSGTVAPAGATSFAGTAVTSGSGSLSVARTVAVAAAVALAGVGSLSVAGSAAVTRGVAFTGAGSLSAVGALSVSGAGASAGTGEFTAAGEPAVSVEWLADGDGTLEATGNATLTATASAELVGDGTLEASGGVVASTEAALDGNGSLAADGTPELTVVAEFDNTGTLTADGIKRGPFRDITFTIGQPVGHPLRVGPPTGHPFNVRPPEA